MSTHRYQQPHSAGRVQQTAAAAAVRHHHHGSGGGNAEVVHDEETYEELDVRERAAEYLDSTEMLMWLAGMRNETRHHYERVMAGFTTDENSVEWEDVYEPTESDVERLKPRSSSSRTALKAKSSGISTPATGSSSVGGGGGPSRTADGSGAAAGKKRRSGERGQRKRRSGAGGGG